MIDIFKDRKLVQKIQNRLPYLFQIAELEISKGGKVGMEIGSSREKILIALLIYKFGEMNVESEIPTTTPEVDVKVCGEPLSIKTITGKTLSGVKIIWTVDHNKAEKFYTEYSPRCSILLVHVNWEDRGGFYYIPVCAQKSVFKELGKEKYIKLPKQGTNPRGIEISREALLRLTTHPETKKIEIFWKRKDIEFNIYEKWIKLWHEN